MHLLQSFESDILCSQAEERERVLFCSVQDKHEQQVVCANDHHHGVNWGERINGASSFSRRMTLRKIIGAIIVTIWRVSQHRHNYRVWFNCFICNSSFSMFPRRGEEGVNQTSVWIPQKSVVSSGANLLYITALWTIFPAKLK